MAEGDNSTPNYGVNPFDPQNQSFSSWLLSRGYVPRDRGDGTYDLLMWNKPGKEEGHFTNVNNIFNKEGSSWQADVYNQMLTSMYGLTPLGSEGLPYSDYLFSGPLKTAAIQALINDQERKAALANRDTAVGTLSSTFSNPTFAEMINSILYRLANPDMMTDQNYEQMLSRSQEANARALNDELAMINQSFANRGLGNSGLGIGFGQRATQDASRRTIENRSNIDLTRAQNRAAGQNVAVSQAMGALGQIGGINAQIAALYGSDYTPTDLSGVASILDTNMRDYSSGRGFFEYGS